MKKDALIKKLRSLKQDLYYKFGIEQIALFGSFARDEAKDESDVDIVILKIKNKNYFTRVQAKYYLEKQLNCKVDLGYFETIRSIIKEEIKKEMIYV